MYGLISINGFLCSKRKRKQKKISDTQKRNISGENIGSKLRSSFAVFSFPYFCIIGFYVWIFLVRIDVIYKCVDITKIYVYVYTLYRSKRVHDRSWAMMYYKADFCVHKEYCLAKCKQIFVSTNIFLWLSGHIWKKYVLRIH